MGKPDVPLPYVGFAAQKRHLSLYLMCEYTDPAVAKRLTEILRASHLSVGKSCIRFRHAKDLPLAEICAVLNTITVNDVIREYEASRATPRTRRAKKK